MYSQNGWPQVKTAKLPIMKTAPTMLIRMHSSNCDCSQRVSRIGTENRSIVQGRVLLANPIVTAQFALIL